MSATLLLLFIPALITIVILKYVFHTTISWLEMAAQIGASLLIVVMIWAGSKYGMMGDTEIINGVVTGKEQQYTSCEHSYQCNCRTVTHGSGKDTYTTTVCDTCYEHSNDWDWVVKSTVGNFDIARVDRRGVTEPKRWSIVKKGQPVALPHGYINYVRAAPDSLFNTSHYKGYKGTIPKYPQVYDYHYADRVIPVGVNITDLKKWNYLLATKLIDLGGKKQANIVVVITNQSPEFAEALRAKWLGGKKNDIIVVIGADYPTIKWVQVFSWAQQDIVNVAMRTELTDSKTLDATKTVDIIAKNVNEHYVRRPMADFKYLADEASPPLWAMIIAVIIGIITAGGLGYLFHNNEDMNFRSY